MAGKGDITLKMDVDISDADSAIVRFKNSTQKAFNSSDKSIQKLGNSLNRVTQDIEKTRTKMNEIATIKQPTRDLEAMDLGIKQIEGRLNQAKTTMGKFLASGNTNSFGFTLAEADVIALEQELYKANTLKQQLIDSGKGYNIIDNTQSEEYRNLNNRLTNLINQGNILHRVLEGVGSVTSKLAGAFKHFTATALSGIKSLIHNGLNRLKDSIRGTANIHGLNFNKMLKTVLKYGFGIRSVFLLYKKLRSEIKKGMGIMGAVFPEIQADINALINSFTAFKASLSSAFQPIFSYVVPALTTLIDYLTSAMNAVANFFAVLTGQGYYYKATKGNNNYAQSVSNAGKAAKEANKDLAEYDKLLVINQDNANSGGGGGGAGGGDAGYQWEKTPTETNEFFESLKKAWAEGDWEGLGELISEKLTEMLESIPWDSIYQKAANFGKGLAEFMNGLISPELFSAVGGAIAGALNTALAFLGSFGKTFNWTDFGDSIAAGINRFFNDFKFKDLVEVLNIWANGLLDAMITAIQGVEWKSIAQNIAEGIAEIDASGIGWKVGKLVDSIVDALNDLLSNKETWTNLGTKIAEGINGFFKGVEGKDLAKLLNNVKDALFNAITTAVKTIEWKEVGKDIAGFLGNLDVGTVAILVAGFSVASGVAGQTLSALAGSSIVSNISSALAANAGTIAKVGLKIGAVAIAMAAAAKIGWEFGTTLGEFIATWLKNKGIISSEASDEYMEIAENMSFKQKIADIKLAFEEGTLKKAWNDMIDELMEPVFDEGKNIIEKAKEIGTNIIEGVKQGVTTALTTIKTWVSEKFNAIIDAVKSFFGIQSPSTKFAEIGGYLIDGLKKGITDAISGIASWLKENVVDKILSGVDKVKEITVTIAGKIGDTFNTVKEKWEAVKDKTAEVVANAKEKVANVLSDMKSKFDTIKDKTAEIVADAKEKTAGVLSSLKEKWDAFTNKTVELVTEAKEKAGSLISTIKDKWENGWTTTKELLAEAKEKARGAIQGLKNLWEKGWTATKQLFTEAKERSVGAIQKLKDSWDKWTAPAKNLIADARERTAGALEQIKGWWDGITDKNPNLQAIAQDASNGVLATLKSAWDTIKDKVSTLTGKAENKAESTLKTLKAEWDTIKKKTATLTAKAKKKSKNTFKSILNAWDTLNNKTVTTTVNLKKGNFTTVAGWLASAFGGTSKGGGAVTVTISKGSVSAKGGVVKSNGMWDDIPQYASGGNVNHGSMFIAGEAGPEIVGHIGNRTEILNKSQLAATMKSAVMDGMYSALNALMPLKINFDVSSLSAIPAVVQGYVLPLTEAFMFKFEEQHKDFEDIKDMLGTIITNLETDSNKEDIVLQLDGRVITKLVWDETQKRYKQTGRSFA